jgi:energy-coupling factor transport system ATP-binding protein
MAVVDSGKIIAYEPMSIIFENDLIYSMGLKIPPYIELFHKLKTKGLYTEKIPKSLSSAIDKLKAMIDKRKINSPLIAAKKPESEIAVPNRRAVVSVRDVCFSYDDMDNKNGKMTLINLNLDIFEGETVAILGKNGAGKSTFVKLINGLRYPTQGDVFVYGKNTKKYENGTLTELVGMVFQNPQHQLFEDSVDKELDFSLKSLRLSNEEKQSIKTEIIEKYSLTSLISQNPFVISGGERKRLALASVMCRSPKVVILDEPTIGQDKIGEEMIKQEILNIKKDGATIIIITHDMDFISDIADRLLIIADGKLIADGNRSQILGNQDLLAKNNLIKPTTFEILEELNEKMKGQDNKDRLYQDFSWDRFEKYVLEGKFE